MKLENLLENDILTHDDLKYILSINSDKELDLLRVKSYKTMKSFSGEKIYLRGLIEFSNLCVNDCYYCGIRKSNFNLNRYMLNKDEILSAAQKCSVNGFGSIVLQSGERNDNKFIDYVAEIVNEIKQKTISDILPNGLSITLCIGEQDYISYKKLYHAGAHRYLLRIESSDKVLFESLHPGKQSYDKRIESLKMLHDIGFQLGTGIMIGIPGQTLDHLADDILFFKEMDVDMIGMGPYIVHKDTPMKHLKNEYIKKMETLYLLSLKMIAATRLYLKNVNIASTTALQAIKPTGREEGLNYGANVFMPLMTPSDYRKNYILYDGKPCIDEVSDACVSCTLNRIKSIGREIAFNEWGDSKHYIRKT